MMQHCGILASFADEDKTVRLFSLLGRLAMNSIKCGLVLHSCSVVCRSVRWIDNIVADVSKLIFGSVQ